MESEESLSASDLNLPANPAHSTRSNQTNHSRLVAIPEGKLLTYEELEIVERFGAEDEDERVEGDQLSDNEPGESTPLLSSLKSEASLESDCNTPGLTSSQASLLMPSLQLSLLSSFSLSKRSEHCQRDGICRSSGSRSRDSSTSLINTGSHVSRSVTVSLVERLSEDGKAPVSLALWNVFSLIQGTSGILGMPYAMIQCGYLGIPLLLFVGIICAYTSILIADCLYDISPKRKIRKRVRNSYSEIAFAVWGTVGARLVDIMIVLFEYSACVLFFIVLSTGMEELFRSSLDLSPLVWSIISATVFIPVVLVKKLSILAWISIISQFATVTCCLILLGYSIGHYSSWHFSDTMHMDPDKLPIALGMMAWSYIGHAIFPNIEGSMRQPQKYNKMAVGAFTSSTFVKILVGFFCALVFGRETKSIVTLNLSSSNSGLLCYVAIVSSLINVYCCYPIDMFLVSNTLDNLCLSKIPSCANGQKYNCVWILITRIILVVGTLSISVAVPQFGLMMSVAGSVIGSLLAFIFPSIFHMVLKRRSIRWYCIVIEVIIVLLGIVIGVVGAISNVKEIKKLY